MSEVIKATRKDIGCYVSDSWGQYACARAVQVAMDFGFTPTRDEDFTDEEWENILYDEEAMTEACEGELSIWLADEADSWMNDNHPVPGAYWGFNDGAWGLWDSSTCDDCSREHHEDDTWREDEQASLCEECYSSRKKDSEAA